MKTLTVCVLSVNMQHGGHIMDTCDVPVYGPDEQVCGYLGAVWGVHERPNWPEILLWDYCTQLDVESLLQANNMHRKFEP